MKPMRTKRCSICGDLYGEFVYHCLYCNAVMCEKCNKDHDKYHALDYQAQSFICTAEEPFDSNKHVNCKVVHPDAKEIGDQTTCWPAGDMITWRCPHCGLTWTQELPQ